MAPTGKQPLLLANLSRTIWATHPIDTAALPPERSTPHNSRLVESGKYGSSSGRCDLVITSPCLFSRFLSVIPCGPRFLILLAYSGGYDLPSCSHLFAPLTRRHRYKPGYDHLHLGPRAMLLPPRYAQCRRAPTTPPPQNGRTCVSSFPALARTHIHPCRAPASISVDGRLQLEPAATRAGSNATSSYSS